MTAEEKARQIYINTRNNANGKLFERGIEEACLFYQVQGIAKIEKIPEPFRVLKKEKTGIFKGRFIAKAEPDFQGTLKNGRSIVFEAKYTSTDTIKQSVITDNQANTLEFHSELGALAAVCVGIKDRYFFIPWEVWRDLKKHTGKKSAKAEEIKEYEIFYKRGIDFLKYF